MFEAEVQNIIERRIAERIPFAVFRMPSSTKIRIAGENGWGVQLNSFNQAFKSGFNIGDNAKSCIETELPSPTPIDEYKKAVAVLRDNHKACGGKTVLSRIVGGHTDIGRIVENAEKYFDLNPNAFCMLAQTSQGCLWLMATPEVILVQTPDVLKTMALAGTRKLSETDAEWDEKNIAEQHIVRTFIHDSLTGLGLRFDKVDTYTLRSDNVEHICTLFESRPDQRIAFEKIIDTLSPTPAVLGYPRPEAMNFISRLERHRRELYSGYTVVSDANTDSLHAFVNLRCARIDANTGRFAIFVGSGITADSDPNKELEETDMKCAPLLKILNTRLESQTKI